MGIQHWAVLHFRRGAGGVSARELAALQATEIGFEGPTGI
jgi:hypothetical protein